MGNPAGSRRPYTGIDANVRTNGHLHKQVVNRHGLKDTVGHCRNYLYPGAICGEIYI